MLVWGWAGAVAAQDNAPSPPPPPPLAQQEEASAPPQVPLSPEEALLEAREAFRNIQFAKLRPLLEPILLPTPKLGSKEARLEARALLGTGLFFEAGSAQGGETGRLKGEASAQFLEVLREDPDFELDPLIYPSSVVDFFEDTRLEHREELDTLRREQGGSGGGELKTIYIERAIRRRNWALNFMPFGIGQFQNGDEVKGTLLGAGQAAALTTNVVSYVWAMGVFREVGGTFPRDATGSLPGSQAETVGTLKQVMYISLATFGVLYALSVGDALWNYESEELLQLRTLDGPPPELAPQNLGPATLVDWTWHF